MAGSAAVAAEMDDKGEPGCMRGINPLWLLLLWSITVFAGSASAFLEARVAAETPPMPVGARVVIKVKTPRELEELLGVFFAQFPLLESVSKTHAIGLDTEELWSLLGIRRAFLVFGVRGETPFLAFLWKGDPSPVEPEALISMTLRSVSPADRPALLPDGTRFLTISSAAGSVAREKSGDAVLYRTPNWTLYFTATNSWRSVSNAPFF